VVGLATIVDRSLKAASTSSNFNRAHSLETVDTERMAVSRYTLVNDRVGEQRKREETQGESAKE